MLLAAVLFVAAFIFLRIFPDARSDPARTVFQAYLVAVAGSYFVFFRTRGQTLPMKTWRLQVADAHGERLTRSRALWRYLYAALGTVLAGVGFVWACIDRDREFLHDRLAGTRILNAGPEPARPQTSSRADRA